MNISLVHYGRNLNIDVALKVSREIAQKVVHDTFCYTHAIQVTVPEIEVTQDQFDYIVMDGQNKGYLPHRNNLDGWSHINGIKIKVVDV